MAKLEDLPDEILLNIFGRLELNDVHQGVALVCKRFFQASRVPELYRVHLKSSRLLHVARFKEKIHSESWRTMAKLELSNHPYFPEQQLLLLLSDLKYLRILNLKHKSWRRVDENEAKDFFVASPRLEVVEFGTTGIPLKLANELLKIRHATLTELSVLVMFKGKGDEQYLFSPKRCPHLGRLTLHFRIVRDDEYLDLQWVSMKHLEAIAQLGHVASLQIVSNNLIDGLYDYYVYYPRIEPPFMRVPSEEDGEVAEVNLDLSSLRSFKMHTHEMINSTDIQFFQTYLTNVCALHLHHRVVTLKDLFDLVDACPQLQTLEVSFLYFLESWYNSGLTQADISERRYGTRSNLKTLTFSFQADCCVTAFKVMQAVPLVLAIFPDLEVVNVRHKLSEGGHSRFMHLEEVLENTIGNDPKIYESKIGETMVRIIWGDFSEESLWWSHLVQTFREK